jgi:hypothetical protein
VGLQLAALPPDTEPELDGQPAPGQQPGHGQGLWQAAHRVQVVSGGTRDRPV